MLYTTHLQTSQSSAPVLQCTYTNSCESACNDYLKTFANSQDECVGLESYVCGYTVTQDKCGCSESKLLTHNIGTDSRTCDQPNQTTTTGQNVE